MALSLDARGASLKRVILNQFRQKVGGSDPYVFEEPYPNLDHPAPRALSTLAVTINGTTVDVDFFLKKEGDGLAVTDTTVHKVNGKARYGYQEKDGVWVRVAEKG